MKRQPFSRSVLSSYLFYCYILITASLVVFTTLSILYLYKPTPLQVNAHKVNGFAPNVVVQQIACAAPKSGQYGKAQRLIYYFLLVGSIVLNVVLRRFLSEKQARLLTIGAAGSAMLYSGVAAFHQVLIFIYSRRATPPCQFIPLGPGFPDLPICYGVDDQDRDAVCQVVGAALLAALPMAAWSKLFRRDSRDREASKPILVLWILLNAASHVFCAVDSTDLGVHYQICPRDGGEPLPGNKYTAPNFDDAFFGSLSALISNSTSSPGHCMYTCFAMQNYRLRANKDIGVWSISTPGLSPIPGPYARGLGISFWTIYLAFPIVVLLETIFAMPISNDHWLRQNINSVTEIKKFWDVHDARRLCARLGFQVVHHFPRYLSAAMFVGYVVFLEWGHWGAPESEAFGEVGQWSAVVVVGFVIIATAFSLAVKGQKKGIP